MRTVRFASVVLVDRRGWVLLQERDAHPVLDPERWGFVGGAVESGESYAEAAYRELAEETGIAWTTGLRRVGRFDVPHVVPDGTGGRRIRNDEFELYAGATSLTDADISCGEGRQIVFVEPVRIAGLALSAGATVALGRFLDSGAYRELTRD
ncbi:MAG: NUDIX domain-containing protein [Nocardioides sp.]